MKNWVKLLSSVALSFLVLSPTVMNSLPPTYSIKLQVKEVRAEKIICTLVVKTCLTLSDTIETKRVTRQINHQKDMKYLIAVLSNRIQAEDAYTTLLKEGIDEKQVEMLGKGYKTADEFGFINPNKQARKQILRMATWLFPFGFAAGYVFNTITEIYLFDWTGPIGNHIIGGFFGAIAALMGAFFVGGGVGIFFGSGDALPYRNRLNEGKYLIVVKGSELISEQATRILRQFNPETLQGYEEPVSN